MTPVFAPTAAEKSGGVSMGSFIPAPPPADARSASGAWSSTGRSAAPEETTRAQPSPSFSPRPGSRLRRPWPSTGWRYCRPSGRTSTRQTTSGVWSPAGKDKMERMEADPLVAASSGSLRSAPSGGGEESKSDSARQAPHRGARPFEGLRL